MQRLTTLRGLEKQREEIRTLERKVQEIEINMGEVTTQSSETWHDNAPYSVLVENLRIASIRLNESHDILNSCRIQAYPTILHEEMVVYGTRVKFRVDGKLDEFCLVGYGESDMDNGLILHDCPLAKLLIGRMKGETFEGTINGTNRTYSVDEVALFRQL